MAVVANVVTFEIHDKLNPELWTEEKLKSEIRDKLLDIAEAFLDYLQLEVEVEDITLTGSLANYNYTSYSDIDLHIITDFKEYHEDIELVRDYFNAKKMVWNTSRNISIHGHKVEIYVQDKSEKHFASGVYSLKNDNWIKKPKQIKSIEDIDKILVDKKKQDMLDIINFALCPDCTIEDAENAKERFMNLRKASLEKLGDLAPENIAFKQLRATGDIERFMKGILDKKDKQLSLDSVQKEAFKDFMNISNKRGPRHQNLTAGVNKIGNPNVKSLGIVAQMHKVDEIPAIHFLKKKPSGFVVISEPVAQKIAQQYNLDWNQVRINPRTLSTSGIQLGFNPATNSYFLRK